MLRILPITACWCFCWSPLVILACPNLSGFYVDEDGATENQTVWRGRHGQLLEIYDQCLLSTEYFALLGAAQLNLGLLAESMESLERSLLLDAKNGAALIDYAEALLLDGQLFAAIEANDMLIVRDDMPENIGPFLLGKRQP